MSQEEQCTQVEEAGDSDQDLELGKKRRLERVLMWFDSWTRSCDQVVDNVDVGQVVHQGHEKYSDYQAEEKLVVCFSNTIVQPSTVVIKLIDAAITWTTMLGSVTDMCFANITFVFIFRSIKIASEHI